MLAGLLAYVVFFATASPWLVGGASNLADRFLYDGYVVDFINIGIGSLRTGIFNVADMAITAGIVLLLFGARRAGRARSA